MLASELATGRDLSERRDWRCGVWRGHGRFAVGAWEGTTVILSLRGLESHQYGRVDQACQRIDADS